MKRIILAAAALSTFAVPAMAQTTASSSIPLSATVAGQCGTGAHRSGGAATAQDHTTGSVSVTLADANGQFAGQTLATQNFGNIWCNKVATITLSATPLTTSTTLTDSGSFTNTFDVTADMELYGPVTTAGATASAAPVTSLGAFELGMNTYTNVAIIILPNALNKRAIAGTYNGSVTLTVQTTN